MQTRQIKITNRFRQYLHCLFCGAILFASGVTSKGLTILPTWDVSIQTDPNAAVITNSIWSAIEFYQARFSDPITVTIKFEKMSSSLLGHSSWWYYNIGYSEFRAALLGHSRTANDSVALANLPVGQLNPVTGTSFVRVKTANLRALGMNGFTSGLPGGLDGIIGLNIDELNVSRNSINPSKYDLIAITEHEIDEVLGLASALDANSADPLPEDLFRYDSFGNRTYTADGDDAYFSIDGTDLLARFNQDGLEDFGDWWTDGPHIPHVQDAYLTPGAITDADIELTALDVIGYTLIPPPQPRIANIARTGAKVIIQGINGLATASYNLLASDDLTLPASQWTVVSNFRLTLGGNFTVNTANFDSTALAQFYVLELK